MDNTDVEFHPEAHEEYLDAIVWYLLYSEPVARAFQREVARGVAEIQESPDR